MNSGETRYGGDHAARVLWFASIREELSGLAAGAQPAIEDAARVDARSSHQTAISLRKIELTLARHTSPFRKERRELRFDLRSDLIATGSNTRTNSSVYVGRSGSKIMAHAFEGTFDKLRGCSTPTGVYRSDGAGLAIQKQNGNAISGSDPDVFSDLVRYQRVAFSVPIAQRMRVQNPI
jgi:hypothetical protein